MKAPKGCVEQYIALQNELADRVRQSLLQGPIHRIGGADVAFSPDGKHCLAVLVVLAWPDLATLEIAHAQAPLDFPYIPGLLSFREAPAVLAAAQKLRQPPDVLILDGQGLAHPRRCGLACHVGVQLDWPTIGCAKSRLIGQHRQPGLKRTCQCSLRDGPDVIGKVLRTRDNVKPVYVSVGHRVSLPQAVRIVLGACTRYRLPEPTRRAHQAVTYRRLHLDAAH